jgi:unspecific peroxygenase
MKPLVAALLAAEAILAFPFVANMPGVDSLGHAKRNPNTEYSKRATCPFNSDHRGAAPYNPKYPYTGAKNGLPGTQIGGVKVPADGDTAHAFEEPGPSDIRGPCPGLNAAANHHVRRSTLEPAVYCI